MCSILVLDRGAVIMTHTDRKKLVDTGKSTGFKSSCNCAVLRYLGIYSNTFRYAQTITDTIRIIRNNGYYCHSRKSQYKGTVSQIRGKISKEQGLYLIWVRGHVMMIDFKGDDIIDINSTWTKGKRIKGIWLIHPNKERI